MTYSSNYKLASSSNAETDPCLQISALSVMRGQRLVIDQLNHQQPAGTLCLLTGTNGVGKSTLLRTISGRLPAESGHITCTLQRFYVGHADGLSGAITGRQNLHSWATINSQPVTPKSLKIALAGFGTLGFADMPVQLLSHGQRRRLALARLLLTQSQSLWVLDEPSAGLDKDGHEHLEKAIATHLARGGGVIAATHRPLLAAIKNPINLKLEPR